MATPARKSAVTQDFVLIESIRDGIVLLKDGGLRAVLMASSLNFALKSEEEQDAIVFQYENFLNSLDFTVQFVVHSRRLNIQPYLDTLAARQNEETQELLRVQIAEYIEFVRSFVELSEVVSKTFYIVVPFQPSIVEQRAGLFTKFFGSGAKTAASGAEDDFGHYKNQLLQRVESVSLGLRRLGLRVVELNTEELIELYYNIFNPAESQRAQIPAQSRE
ncbi:hypothetical protein C4552_01740 [Candidatus Parcubacteria bacterium]|nr:MAG: hypothetical protein C4552_01740 [Candidatus Parcubacteria bacterium]